MRKRDMCTTARAFTYFLTHLIQKIRNNLRVLRVNDVAAWVQWANRENMCSITKLGCKEGFNKIQPKRIGEHMSEGNSYDCGGWVT